MKQQEKQQEKPVAFQQEKQEKANILEVTQKFPRTEIKSQKVKEWLSEKTRKSAVKARLAGEGIQQIMRKEKIFP